MNRREWFRTIAVGAAGAAIPKEIAAAKADGVGIVSCGNVYYHCRVVSGHGPYAYYVPNEDRAVRLSDRFEFGEPFAGFVDRFDRDKRHAWIQVKGTVMMEGK